MIVFGQQSNLRLRWTDRYQKAEKSQTSCRLRTPSHDLLMEATK
jgi:hypothetical protein